MTVVVAMLLVSATGPAGSVAAADPESVPQFNPPKSYYLALGDSIPHGNAWANGVAAKASFVYVFADKLQQIRPSIRVVNYGCSGESTATFISGGCPMQLLGLPLQDPFEGAQLEAALSFLRLHRGEVSPITLTLASNDVRQLITACGYEFACIKANAPAAIASIGANLSYILGRLRAEAPEAEIIVTGMWSSFIGAFDLADPLIMELNAEISRVASGHRARFADPFPVFNPQGDPDAELAAICTYLRLCTDGDSHPSAAGNAALAEIVFEASDYARLR